MINQIISPFTNEYSGRIKNMSLHHDDDAYYLSFAMEYEDSSGVYILDIPKMYICQDEAMMSIKSNYYDDIMASFLGRGAEFILDKDENGIKFYEKRIQEKVHEMTLTEIEKKLGYKVKIVDDK